MSIAVQHIELTLSGATQTTANIAISPVDIRNSRLIIAYQANAFANTSQEFKTRVYFSSISNNISDQVTIQRHSGGGNVVANVSVIEDI